MERWRILVPREALKVVVAKMILVSEKLLSGLLKGTRCNPRGRVN